MRTIEKFERHPGRQQRRPQWQLHKYLFGDLPLALIVFTIYCCCCCGYCNAGPTVVEGGGQGRGLDSGPFSIKQQQQQHQHQSSLQSQYKYQPVPYQMQAQQQQQQQHLQQQQYEYQQMLMQQREEAYGQQPMQRSASTEHTDGQLAPTQSQLLKTGASLVVGGDSSSPDSNYTDDFHGATAQRRSNGAPPRKRKRRPQTLPNGEIGSSKPHCKEHSAKYWRGQVDDDKAAMTASREETRATAAASPSYTRRKHAAAGASIREPLAALEKEQKLYEQRDKQRQQQQQQKRQQPPATHASEEPREADKSYRRPYGHTKKDFFSLPAATTVDDTVAAAMHTETTPAQRLGASHLKNLLKNADGLSLSEILQEKNLSLDDLLRGKQTALLALQTTTSVAAKTKGEQPFARPLKPMRKYGAATSTAATSREVVSPATSPEDSEDPTGDGSGERPGRNKLKVKALQQRLKLFGTASRAPGSPLLHQIDNVITKKRDSPTLPTSTTSTTTTTTTTTRMPLYKKRLSQRPTLKPPSLLKGSTVTPPSSTTTKEPAFKQPAFKEATFRMPNFKEPSPKEASLEPSSRESPSTEPPFEDTTFKEPNSRDSIVKDLTTSTAKPHFAENSSEDADSFELDDEDEDFDITTPQASEIHTHREPQIEDVVQKIYSKGSAEDRSAERQTTMLIEAVNKATTTARARAYGSTTPATTEKTATTSETPSSSSLSAVSTSTSKSNEASPSTTTPRPRVRFGNNFKSNSIESEGSGLEHSKGDTDADGLENYFDEATAKFNEDPGSSEDAGKQFERFPAKPTGYLEYSVPDVDGIDDRTDLLELIEDRRSGNRLFKVLEQRNMTLEELIEHRKRGASQLHLSTILQNQSRFFPGQKVVLQDNMDIVTAFENFPHFNLIDLKSVKPDDIKTDSQGSSYFTSIIDIEPTDEVYRDEKGNAVGDKAGQIETAYAPEKAIGFFPAFTNLALATLTSSTRRVPGDSKRQPFFLAQPKMLLESQELEDIDLSADGLNETISLQLQDDEQPPSHQTTHSDTVEAIENEVARAHDLIDLELSGHGFKRSPSAVEAASMLQSNLYTSLPAGIRSAIVASTAIVLTAMATFAVIFMAIRWRQQRQRKTYFSKAYNSMKSRLQQMGANGPTATAPLTASQIWRPQMTSTTNTSSSCSSLRDMEELVMGSRSTKVCSVATLSTGGPALHRQSSLVFGSRGSCGNLSQLNATTSCVEAKGSTSHIQVAVHGLGARSLLGSAAGSTTSLAMSLNNGLSVSTTKLNAMDPRAPEVQEYLFHALRKSY